MNTWRTGKGGEEGGEGNDANADHTTWISPNGKIRRQIDYIIVRQRFQNSVHCCAAVKGWRGNYNQQRQHAVIRAKIKISWALNYLSRNNQQSRNINGTINYDKDALRNNKKEMETWAEAEGQINISDDKKYDNEHIWNAIKTKLQKMITTKFPPNKNSNKRKKNEEWARDNEKERLGNANQNTKKAQKRIEKIDKRTRNTQNRIQLYNAIIAWEIIANYSKQKKSTGPKIR